MDIQEIDVEIDAQGQVNLHVKGFTGNQCLDITRDLENALGNIILERQMNPEAAIIPDPARLDLNHKPGVTVKNE